MMYYFKQLMVISCLPVLFVTSCSHVTFAQKSRQGLMLLAIPPTAQVYVDHRYWGTGIELERIPRLLDVGRHELLIVAPGCYPYFSTFTLRKHELLRRRPGLVRVTEN